MENALTLARNLRGKKPSEVVTNSDVSNQFVYIYNSVHGEGGEGAYNRESVYFAQQLKSSDLLRKCTGPSIYYAFIDLAVKGLSLQPGTQAQCYLLPRNVCTGVGPDGRKQFETTCQLTISGYGELALRKAAGQIRYADNPVVVYEGDLFEWGDCDGRKYVKYSARLPRKSSHIVACFIRIVRPDGSVDYGVMTEPDWLRLAEYSAKNNARYDETTRQRVKGKPNELYTSGENNQIDAGFLIAKTVKHAFRTYPRIAVGMGSAFAADVPDDQPGFDPYGGVDRAMEQQQAQRQEETGGSAGRSPDAKSPADEEESFCPPENASGSGVRVQTDDDDTF